jgi:hypothetical protein
MPSAAERRSCRLVQFGLDFSAQLLPILPQVTSLANNSLERTPLASFTRLLDNPQVALWRCLLAHNRIRHDCKTGLLVLNRNNYLSSKLKRRSIFEIKLDIGVETLEILFADIELLSKHFMSPLPTDLVENPYIPSQNRRE